MVGAQITAYYFAWHYSRGITDYLRNWMNLVWFLWHYFAVGLMLKTLFATFRRIETPKRPGFHPDDMAGDMVVGMLMRLIGFFMKSVIILVALIALLFVLVGGALLFMLWLCAPLTLIVLTGAGIVFLLL